MIAKQNATGTEMSSFIFHKNKQSLYKQNFIFSKWLDKVTVQKHVQAPLVQCWLSQKLLKQLSSLTA